MTSMSLITVGQVTDTKSPIATTTNAAGIPRDAIFAVRVAMIEQRIQVVFQAYPPTIRISSGTAGIACSNAFGRYEVTYGSLNLVSSRDCDRGYEADNLEGGESLSHRISKDELYQASMFVFSNPNRRMTGVFTGTRVDSRRTLNNH